MIDFFLGPALGQEDLALALVIAQNVALVIVIVLVAKRHFSQATMARNMTAIQPERHKLLILEASSGGNRGLPATLRAGNPERRPAAITPTIPPIRCGGRVFFRTTK